MSASSIGSTRRTYGPGGSLAIDELAVGVSVEVRRPALPVSGLNATTCAPSTPLAVLGDAADDAAGVDEAGGAG